MQQNRIYNVYIYMEYSYCKNCQCWHSKYDNCTDVQKDKLNKDNYGRTSD